ncbi:MAG: T9SS type A sorting domain-containing protein [Flavobacteriales bacterium]|nr:T9SS type A sorting domain-containing protein [Flavobacteriales bacterium]
MFFAGDLNIKSSAEAAWILLTATCSHLFKDPLNLPGLWNNNTIYKSIHTQSTRTSANPGCCGGSTGGMDDRFDFILVNNPVMTGDNHLTYIPNSYETIGNDGQHFNLALNEAPANSVVPANVAQSLFNMSDHLPVSLKIKIQESPVGLTKNYKKEMAIRYWISDGNNGQILNIKAEESGMFQLTLIDAVGKIILEKVIKVNDLTAVQKISLSDFNPGIYSLKINKGERVIKDKLLISP